MSGSNVWLKCGKVYNLLGTSGATATATGSRAYKDSPHATFHGVVTGTGALTATIVIEASNDGDTWVATALGTITLSGNDSVADGFSTTASWKYVRARVTAITGTSATAQVYMGV